jgi:hypothetical protein
MGRITNRDKILKLLIANPDGLSNIRIRDEIKLSDETYKKEIDRLIWDGILEKYRAHSGGIRLTAKYRNHIESIPVEDEEEEQSGSTGTAFFVSKEGHLLTNYHVIEGWNRVVVYQGVKPSRADVLKTDPNNDLALLKVAQGTRSVPVFRTDIEVGEDIGVYGFPQPGLLAMGGNFTRGSVTAMTGFEDDTSLFQLQAPIQGGNSGGPVVDGLGNVVGVVRAGIDNLQIANFAIKADLALSFLKANGISAGTTRGTKNKPDWPVIAGLARSFCVLAYCDGGEGDVPQLHTGDPNQTRNWLHKSRTALRQVFLMAAMFGIALLGLALALSLFGSK